MKLLDFNIPSNISESYRKGILEFETMCINKGIKLNLFKNKHF